MSDRQKLIETMAVAIDDRAYELEDVGGPELDMDLSRELAEAALKVIESKGLIE